MNSIKKYLIVFAAAAGFFFIPMSCTDLEVEPYSELTAEKFFADPDNLIFAFGAAYSNLYHLVGHKYGLVAMDCGTDLLCVPQRGGDWFDGGEWHRWHRHTVEPRDGYTSRWWDICYQGINTCNRLIFEFTNAGDIPNADVAIKELRAFRALYYYWLTDLFGNIPLVTDFDVPTDFAPSTTPRAEVYSFLETELLESRDALPKETGLNSYSRVTYWVAQTVLAKLYMNAEVYTGTAQWDKAEAVLDDIINNGGFSLASDYLANFQDLGYQSPEVIMGVPFDEVDADGFEIHLFTLHYNLQEKFGLENLPWNGICGQESLFDFFDEDDARLAGLLHGPQFNAEGEQITDPSFEKFNPSDPTAPRDPDGPGLNLTPEINELEPGCLRQAGIRIAKFPFIEGTARYTSNDFPIFRYADILLLKAEVMTRQGDGTGAAEYVNMVRSRAGVDPLATVTMDDLADERARELYAEGHRRSDMIRFGIYNEPRWEFEGAEPCKILWPIPENAINTNPNLTQNPCY